MKVEMKRLWWVVLGLGFFGFIHPIFSDTFYVSPEGNHVAPYSSWSNAATNIQDAIDASLAGDTVLVSNGVYLLSSEIVVGNNIMIRSVNGSEVTIVDGGGSVRCFNLGRSACTISGFTIQNGYSSGSGGGIYCANATPSVGNCVISGNSANYSGGGSYYGTLNNCVISGNSAKSGGGSYHGTLNNCTLTGNSAGSYGGGSLGGTLNNCIIWKNTAPENANWEKVTLNYCCTTPVPSGMGNISVDPQLADLFHISVSSPCIGAGSASYSSGIDVDGEVWETLPAIGCDEYYAGSITGTLSVAVSASYTQIAMDFVVDFTGNIIGHAKENRWDFGDGTVISNTLSARHKWSSSGDYEVVFTAFNETHPEGVAATVTVSVITASVHYVDIHSSTPEPPFNSWATAATNIQEAIDLAGDLPGTIVLVEDGVYETGGRVVYGSMTNRVVIDKPIVVKSVNGSDSTFIKGAEPNGDSAIRCVYLGTNATLVGFTVTNGYTRTSGDSYKEQSGGGIWCESSAVVSNCTLTGNLAKKYGGGSFGGTLSSCSLSSNSAGRGGGGSYRGTLNNCTLTGNSAHYGGGSTWGTVNNCTLTGNSASSRGGGIYRGMLNNCIIWNNTAPENENWYEGTLNYCCTTPLPLPLGTGNISTDPQLADSFHISASSPCIGVGKNSYFGVDIDGDVWKTPPSMGCDEYYTGSITGALVVSASASYIQIATDFVVDFTGSIIGHAKENRWDFGDGTVVSNTLSARHKWSSSGDYEVVFTAFNETHPDGISETVTVSVITAPVHYVNIHSSTPEPPFNSWATAATNIQEAIDLAGDLPGTIVLVEDGVYETGGRVVYGSMTNRVVIDKPIVVKSVNGLGSTFIKGAGPNGDSAIRCVYLGTNATLVGFTLTNGYTRTSGDNYKEQSGGGVWCESSAVVSNCTFSSNSAGSDGGGSYGGTFNNCTLTRNSASKYGGGSYRGTLNNCTLTGNSARYDGGGSSGGTLSNCTLTGNSAGSGGGSSSGILNNCTLIGNSASSNGGGCYNSTLNNCMLFDNSAGFGGGIYRGMLNNCILTGNSAYYGGGSYRGTLNNCTLFGNSADSGGGSACGTLNNCTLFGNSASQLGGGCSFSARGNYDPQPALLNNCIIWNNTAPEGANYQDGCILNYCCTTPLPLGTGNISTNPLLVDFSHLSASSPCIGAGKNSYSGVDIDGDVWKTPPSMGCDEYYTGSITGALVVSASASCIQVATDFSIDFVGGVIGHAKENRWDFGDGTVMNNTLSARHKWSGSGDYEVVFMAFNETHPEGVAATVTVSVITAPVHYVDIHSSTPEPPFNSWATAATNIQDAVDLAETLSGTIVLVADGVYETGGRAVYGSMTNRVVIDKPIIVKSVNGSDATIIKGAGPNGDSAIRCVYLGTNATLIGFTVTNGHTRTSGDYHAERSGGGIWCESSAVVSNCTLTGNSARYGGGSSYGTLNNCMLTGNLATYDGGGSYDGTLNNCMLTRNSAARWGGGSIDGTLNNCTLVDNSASQSGGGCHVGYPRSTSPIILNNCIIWNNIAPENENWDEGTLNYCCTTPLPSGTGNISTDPQLADSFHISASSPCIGVGRNYSFGDDIDGDAWLAPPSIGCDEYYVGSITGALTVSVSASHVQIATGFSVDFSGSIVGHAKENRWDFGDGTVISNTLSAQHEWISSGDYNVVFTAFNETYPEGISTMVTITVAENPIHYVNLNSATPVKPYRSWATAATNIQDAVDAAFSGGTVLVSDGVYETGGRVVYGSMTNRVVIDKLITVKSVNGSDSTFIKGAEPNGDNAVRCVYLGTDATLVGFTLTDGHTRTSGDSYKEQSGGGVWCESSAVVSNCTIFGNSAGFEGGGSYDGTLNNCTFSGNSAGSGGGSSESTLNNCTLSGNLAESGGGSRDGTLNNCIIWNNIAPNGENWYEGTLNYCCTTPLPSGDGNISIDPQFADSSHISASSPCIGAGSVSYSSGVDIDGDAWQTPPSMGCDEYSVGSITGALSVAVSASETQVFIDHTLDFSGSIIGHAKENRWDFGDGTVISNTLSAQHEWISSGEYNVVFTVFNETHPEGISATVTVTIYDHILYVNVNSATPTKPYRSWATAATTIQDAVDVALSDDTVLVSNGVYLLSSEIVVGKNITVRSINGSEATIVDGGGSVRCFNLGRSACTISGFTIQNGYSSGDGGGIYCASTIPVVENCVINGNSADSGGGSYFGTLNNCMLTRNSANNFAGGSYCGTLNNCTLTGNSARYGGGSFDGTLNNCTLTGNSVHYAGGGSYRGTLNNCTLTGNSARYGGGSSSGTLNNCTLSGNSAESGGGSRDFALNNCIIWNNTAPDGANWNRGTLNYCCTTPLPSGDGNISIDPQFADSSHISASSPCIGAGSVSYSSGVDIDGDAWQTPPSMGCDEYSVGSITGALSVAVSASETQVFIDHTLDFSGSIIGHAKENRWDFGDGTVISNTLSAQHEWLSSGEYNVVFTAFNETHPEGISATVTVTIYDHILYVNVNSATPTKPYRSWATAATTIQDAVDVALSDDTVLVTNGVYETGGRVVYGSMTNRVVIDKPITVKSVNGSNSTFIKGAGPNGDSAVRCVCLGTDATLVGFTVTNGHTRTSGDSYKEQSGGGVLCEPSAVVSNCTLIGNSAGGGGGGSYRGTLNNCTLTGNSAEHSGGGSFRATLNNCTLSGNSASYYGGGSRDGTLNNCIIWNNTAPLSANWNEGTLNYCCTTPLPSGNGNISIDPQFADFSHISASSPCIGAGSVSYSSGVDIDGDIWQTPPSMGCDEYSVGSITGTLSVAVSASETQVFIDHTLDFSGSIIGHAKENRWDFGDGTVISNTLSAQHEWISSGEYNVVFTVFNETHPEGISATVTVTIYDHILYVNVNSATPTKPYRSWATAATTIQDAVDVALSDDTVLVTNGVYETGGRVVYGSMTNRVVIDKPITVKSVNGLDATIIKGAGPNGNSVVRCVYLGTDATLVGFTVTNGHTRTSGDRVKEQFGGGIWCEPSAVVSNCTFTGNSAGFGGGGSYSGTLNNCVLTRNSAGSGGGSFNSTLSSCILTENSVRYDGGGSYFGTLNNCTLSGNSASRYGGGSSFGTLNNCTLFGNSAESGGGSRDCALNNCIIWNNTAANDENCYGGTLNYCCTTPLPSGTGNITNNPQFVSSTDYHLSSSSPCIDAGDNVRMPSNRDFNGIPRPLDGDANGSAIVDMGCYEYFNPVADSDGDTMPDSFEIDHGLDPTKSSDATGNLDHDACNNLDEFIAGTDPTNSASVFKAGNSVAEVDGTNCFVVEWFSISDRLYSVQWSTNLAEGFQVLETGIEHPQHSYTDTVHGAESDGYYKVDVELKR